MPVSARRDVIFEQLSDLAVLEEARARLRYDDEALFTACGVSAKNTLNVWRTRKGIPAEHRRVLLKIINDRLRPDELERQGMERRIESILAHVNNNQRRLDEVLERLRGIEEVRGLVQRLLGPLPGAQQGRRAR